jgi:urease accessory protein
MLTDLGLLRLLQLTSSSLPVGAFSYSEGLEWLVERGTLRTAADLEAWLRDALTMGAIRTEAAVVARVMATQDPERVLWWDRWLTATRESEELRQQSLQMGTSLLRLLGSLEADVLGLSGTVNFATAYGLGAAAWSVGIEAALLGYLHAWAANLVSAAVRLVPLGQTDGQRVLTAVHPAIERSASEAAALQDDRLEGCGFGLALASMAHETQYSRLFRS